MEENLNLSAKAQQVEEIKSNTNETLNKETMKKETYKKLELFLKSKEDFAGDILVSKEYLPTKQNGYVKYSFKSSNLKVFGYFTDLYVTVDWYTTSVPKISFTPVAENMYDFMIPAASIGEVFVFYFEPKCCIWYDNDEAIVKYKEKLYECTLRITKWYDIFEGQMTILKLR